jgi:DNA-binding response OmpR family regulator
VKPRILVVDGGTVSRENTRLLLCSRYDVRLASSGPDAVRIANVERPDLALVDSELPGFSGTEVCRRLRKEPRLRSTKIMLASTSTTARERVAGYAAGADDCIQKPFHVEELLAKVAVLARLKSAEEVSELKDELLYLVAHELRTPLTGMMSGVEILCDEKPVEDTDRRMLAGIMLQSCHRLLSLTEDGLLLSRLRAGAFELHPARCDIDSLTAEVAESCRALAADRLMVVELAVPEGVAIDADAALLRTLVRCMIENAVLRSDGGGAVRLQAERNGYGVSLTVAHQGSANTDPRNWDLHEILQAREVDGVKVGCSMAEALVSAIAEVHGAQLDIGSVVATRDHFVECRFPVRTQVVATY